MQEQYAHIIPDYRLQIVTGESDIAENEKMLREVEPGFWMRTLTGYFFFAIEVLLYLLIIGVICLTVWINAHWFAFSLAVTDSTRVNVQLHNDDLNTILYLLTGFFMFTAFIIWLLALLLRKSRQNLFKLANVAEYLDKTLKAKKIRRDKAFEILVSIEK